MSSFVQIDKAVLKSQNCREKTKWPQIFTEWTDNTEKHPQMT